MSGGYRYKHSLELERQIRKMLKEGKDHTEIRHTLRISYHCWYYYKVRIQGKPDPLPYQKTEKICGNDNISRNNEADFRRYMKKNPIYLADYYPGKTVDEACTEAFRLKREHKRATIDEMLEGLPQGTADISTYSIGYNGR